DDPDVRGVLEEFLVLKGYHVRASPDGAAAVRELAASAPGVVLLDIEMPGLSGVDALPTIRAMAPATAVIMVSGTVNVELAKRDVEHVLRARGHRIRRAVPGQHVRDVADGDQLHAVARARGEMIEKRRRAELLRQAAQRLADVVVGPAAPCGDAVQRSIE